MCRVENILSQWMHRFLTEVKQSETLPFCFTSYSVNNYSFHNPVSAMFFTFWCFLWVPLLFKIAPGVGLSYCLLFLCIELWCALWRIHVLDMLCSGITGRLAMSSLSVNKLSLNENTLKKLHLIDWWKYFDWRLVET